MKIKKGDKFLCIKDVRMEISNRLVYSEGKVYKSEFNDCITDEDGDNLHYWRGVNYINEHFKKLD